MANMKKFSDMKDIGHLCAHYERSVKNENYGNPDIDKSKLHLDKINLAPDRKMKQTEYIKNIVELVQKEQNVKIRKDAVRMCCWVIDTPKNLPAEKKEEFFQETYKFLTDRYGTKSGMGEDVCISAYIHKSETTEHLHYAFIPVLEKNGKHSLCAKEVVGRDDLKTFHVDLGEYLESKGICRKTDILNGATQRDASGRVLSVKELKRNRVIERERNVDRWATRTVEHERSRW